MRGLWKFAAVRMVLAATCLLSPCVGADAAEKEANTQFLSSTEPAVCGVSMPKNSGKAALRLVCRRDTLAFREMTVEKAIVVGFVGGFVGSHDMNHPEVQFAAHLRETYPSQVHAEVFANHDGKHALLRVLELLSKDGDGVLTSREKESASIIIYGHSWGGAQVLTLARELGQRGIPVSLAILVDSVHKPGHDDAAIPPNVRNAVNFYQTRGLIHGRSRIRASDPQRTNLIGNFHMRYEDRPINCDNYPWIARHLNKPHHEIENDPLVWEQIASLIDSVLFKGDSTAEGSLLSTALVMK
jgi:pimeloyl-ACP methyl ester carboxylesterase